MKGRFRRTALGFLVAVCSISTSAQSAKDFYHAVLELASNQKSFVRLYGFLDSLQATCIPSRSSIYLNLDRDLEFGYRHKRIGLRLNFEPFQIDLLTKGDTIFYRSLQYSEGHFKDFEIDEATIRQFLQERNNLYGSSKTISDLKAELRISQPFATHCGNGSPITKRGQELNDLVKEKNIEALHALLQNISPEEQAYGVLGLEKLLKKGEVIPESSKRLIEHIKRRNSEVVICSGCISGIVEKIYNIKHNINELDKNERLFNQLEADTLFLPSGFVNDYEDLFSDAEEEQLRELLQDYEKRTSNEVVIVTLPGYVVSEAEDIEPYTLYLLNKWRVGKKDKKNGMLIGISRTHRFMRIQNGYGIEKVFSDRQTKEVIDNFFIPAFKKGKYFEGTWKGVREILNKVP